VCVIEVRTHRGCASLKLGHTMGVRHGVMTVGLRVDRMVVRHVVGTHHGCASWRWHTLVVFVRFSALYSQSSQVVAKPTEGPTQQRRCDV
jgi:hypothetical protein